MNPVTITSDFEGSRLDNFLLRHLKGVPRTCVYRIVRTGEVRVNKGRVKVSHRLKEGDVVRIPPLRMSEEKSTPPIRAEHPDVKGLADCVLYEDDGLLILNKPAGMAVHAGSGLSFGIIEALRALRPECASIELVHRLDRETSGCLMIAKNRATLKELHRMFREGEVEKSYLALVTGRWAKARRVEASLTKVQSEKGEKIIKVCKPSEGKSAVTEFAPIKFFERATLVEAKPLTGRTHQIRVHAKHAGHPIVGDRKYGSASGASRLFLHAHQLRLKLPGTERQLHIEAPLDSEAVWFGQAHATLPI